MYINEFKEIISAVKVFGDNQHCVDRIIIRAANSAALPNSAYFDFRRFKDPANPIQRMHAMGVRVFVVREFSEQYSQFLSDSAFLVVENVATAINLYINHLIDCYKGKVIAVPQRSGNCCLKDWMYRLLSINYTVFVTTRYVDELDFIENVSNISNNFQYAILEIPDHYNFPCISHIEQRDNVAFDDDEFGLECNSTEKLSQIKLSFGSNSHSICIPFCDQIHCDDATHCLCYLVKENIYVPEVHNPIFETLTIPDTQIKMRDIDLNIGIISCFSTVNNLYSITKTFDFLARQNQFLHRVAVVANPDLQGLSKDEFFSQLFFAAQSADIQRIVFIGYFEQIPHCEQIRITKYDTVQDYIDNFNFADNQGCGIAFKGKRYEDFADAFDFFNVGNHDTILEVSLTALKHNLNYYRKLLKPNTKMVCMVKANCYGAGSYQLCNTLQNNGVDYLCVAFVEEGIALRLRNITLPIIVMNYDGKNYKQLANYNLEPVLFSTERTQKFIEILRARGIRNYPVHIKLDTGMHRSGFMPHELYEFCNLVNSNSEILDIKSMFTHFVSADDENEDFFSDIQNQRFTEMADTICQLTKRNPLRHICNSVGIERLTKYQHDMVRLGIGLYGVAYQATDQLMTISKWKTNIVQIKNIEPTETVGYNRRGKINTKSRIALIPVGYADGLNRKFSNGNLYVEVNGKRAPLIGNICMDMCMVNITGIDCQVGDEVTIFGSNRKLIEMANTIGTIPYEILTGINQRVKRVYVE